MTLELSVLRSADELDRLGEEWDLLIRSAERSSPFLLRGWLVPWLRIYGENGAPMVLIARRDGRLVAALPMHVRQRFGVLVAGFAGGRHSEIADLVLAPGEDEATARAVVQQLDADVIHVFGLPAGSALERAVAPERLRGAVRAEAPVLIIDASWDELYATRLSSQRKKNHRKRLRQLQAEGSVDFRVVREAPELEGALEEAFRLHALRWDGRPDRSGFTTAKGKEFHRAAVRALAPDSVPVIVLVLLDGRPIAHYYYLRLGERAVAGDMAFDPAYAAFSPGWIATIHTLEVAARDGAAVFEFLGGTEEYKLLFADGDAPLSEAVGCARTLRGRVYQEGMVAALRLRRRLKESARARRLYRRLSDFRRS
jgi:CelD/BcsL family acetyltransferase involved in cellulose biosynthesis